MSGPTGTHLQAEDLDEKMQEELEKFGKWAVEKGNFEPVTNEVHKCGDKNGGKKLEPILKALEYKVRNLLSGSCSKAPKTNANT